MPRPCKFSNVDYAGLLDTACNLIHYTINRDINSISEEDFEKNIFESVKKTITIQVDGLYERDVEPDIHYVVVEALNLIYETFIPKRSFTTTFANAFPNIDKVTEQIEILRSKPQPEQRTPEWYERRHNLITASNAYLAFGSEANKNRLIYEKCQPINKERGSKVNIDSPMHKGQKYEPLSVLFYERKYNTKIEDFGCITHDKYSFLGASPDGINCDKTSPRYGRMLEIKNISNREITGIPKKEYWTQMQLQMETCKLPECDFLETRFIEYESYDDFIADGTFTHTLEVKEKGIIMCFNRDERPIYEYAPIGITEEEYINWEQNTMKDHECDTWISNVYWRLDEFSCILVLRNTFWFNSVISKMEDLWKTVLKERVEGYEHRAPKKRVKREVNTSLDSISEKKNSTTDSIQLTGCAILIDE